MGDGTRAVPASVTIADGTEVRVGGVAYGGDGRGWVVVGIDPWREARPVLARSDDAQRLYRELRPGWLRAEPPDTMNRVWCLGNTSYREYWGCTGALCGQCPVMAARGRRPREAYGCDNCEAAMRLDLARRAFEVGRRGGAPSYAPDWRGDATDGQS